MSILTDIDYDEFGRPHRTTEPIAASASMTSYSPSTQTQMTETIYEFSPLHRQESVTPPSWYATQTTYGTNVMDEVMNHATGAYYNPGTLYKISTIDPEGQTTEIFSDRRGNQILSRVKASPTTIDNAQIADTYTIYDDKDRPIFMLPPETSQSQTDLIHKMVYSGDDLVLIKDDPDCAPVEHVYDLRDLMIARQDGERRAESKWYRIVHDVYGNSIAEGFSETSSSTITDTLVSNEWGISGITKGKLLKSKEAILGAPDDLTITKSYEYDDRGRRNVTRCNSILHRALGSIVDSIVYDPQDLVIEQYYQIVPDDIMIARRWTHDHIGRQKKSLIQVTTPDPDQPNGLMQWPEQELSELSYNAKELITDLNLGVNLQNVDFGYNARRLLRNLNTSFSGFVSSDDPVTGNKDLFGMNIGYESEVDSDFIGVQGLTDGNISNIQWRYRYPDNSTSYKTRYRYSYDFLKRLTAADDQTTNNNGDHSTSYTYKDKRGNIESLTRLSDSDVIDNLSYTYHTGSNRIKSVSDASNSSIGFKDNTSMDYVEDENGYITMDAETGANITRDHNNLMTTISVNDSTLFIHNFRAANGVLHRRLTDSAGVVTIIDRIGSIEYRNGAISVLHHNDGYITINRPVAEELRISDEKDHTAIEEGITIHSDRILMSGADETNTGQEFINLMEGFMVMPGAQYLAQIDTFTIDGLSYFYTIKDHLGSPRVVFSDQDGNGTPTVEDITNYYPFGLEWSESQPDRIDHYRQSYNDKEAISYTNYLEFEARCYLKSINIFDGPDPISSQFPHVNSYNYAELSPVANIDLWGLQAAPYMWKQVFLNETGYNPSSKQDMNKFVKKVGGEALEASAIVGASVATVGTLGQSGTIGALASTGASQASAAALEMGSSLLAVETSTTTIATNVAADAVVQTTTNIATGQDPVENFDVIGSLSSGLKNPFVGAFMDGALDVTLSGDISLGSTETIAAETAIGGSFGKAFSSLSSSIREAGHKIGGAITNFVGSLFGNANKTVAKQALDEGTQ
jgi:RHS repeat-associated protein